MEVRNKEGRGREGSEKDTEKGKKRGHNAYREIEKRRRLIKRQKDK